MQLFLKAIILKQTFGWEKYSIVSNKLPIKSFR